MATIIAPSGSFVQFATQDVEHCIFGTVRATLPVYQDDDVAFQFVIQGTEEEIDELAEFGNTGITVGLVDTSEDELTEEVILEFIEQVERFRISDTDLLCNWTHGFPGFMDVVTIGQCFKVVILLNALGEDFSYSSNRFERVGDGCFTTVIEYGSNDNAFGFNYCYSSPDSVPGGGTGGEPPNPPPTGANCTPSRITFSNMSSLVLPYTQGMTDMYGDTPTVQVWIYDTGGELVRSEVEVKMDAFPPTSLSFDFGGNASGVIFIK